MFKSCVVQHNMLYSQNNLCKQPSKREQSYHLPLASPQEALLNSQFLNATTAAMRTFNSTGNVPLVAHKPLKNDPTK